MTASTEPKPSEPQPPALLPILIIPGFMGSALEVQSSKLRPGWDEKQVWGDMKSLGFSPKYFGISRKKEEGKIDPEQQERLKSSWMEHIRFQKDMRKETPGVMLRHGFGLDGVCCDKKDLFTSHDGFSMEPLIDALENAGYNQSEVNLDAAPYDWRLPPSYLEIRYRYFTKTIQRIEDMYNANNKTPVILMGYSLGAKVAHYLLNCAKLLKGQDWIDSVIHTFIPVSAPHLGTPMALRNILSGDKMGFDKFLNSQETLSFGRSLGSLPWLLPRDLPPGVPSSAYVLNNGVLKVEFPSSLDPTPLVGDRRTVFKPKGLQLVVSCGLKSNQRKLDPLETPFRNVSNRGICSFHDIMSFSTDPQPKNEEFILQIALKEPHLAKMKPKLLNKALRYVPNSEPTVLKAGSGTTLALSEPISIPKTIFKGKQERLQVILKQKEDSNEEMESNPRIVILDVNVEWVPHRDEVSVDSNCPVISKVTDLAPTLNVRKYRQKFNEINGHDMMHCEGLDDYLLTVHNIYNCDNELGPRSMSSIYAPPINRVHALYGINLPTEIGAAYHRKDSSSDPIKEVNIYDLDKKASLSHSDYRIKNGIILETSSTRQVVAKNRQVSGDGYVPYWSLHHPTTWKCPGREVTIVELEGAEHHKILRDTRLHEEILKYSRDEAEELERKRKDKSLSFWPFKKVEGSTATEYSSSDESPGEKLITDLKSLMLSFSSGDQTNAKDTIVVRKKKRSFLRSRSKGSSSLADPSRKETRLRRKPDLSKIVRRDSISSCSSRGSSDSDFSSDCPSTSSQPRTFAQKKTEGVPEVFQVLMDDIFF